MNEIQFDEDQLGNLQALGAALFAEDPSDPRSWNYQRKLVRPKIRWARILLFAFLLLSGAGCVYLLLTKLTLSPAAALGFAAAFALVVFLIHLKRICICLVQIYQRYAPASIRNKCRFEPSCSQYMILALQKYGLWQGLRMGIGRLKRCNAKDGGFDYP